MLYQKSSAVFGKWAKASELGSVKSAKIVSETNAQPSQFKNKDGSVKMQDVCKAQFDGVGEVLNVSMNKCTINGLVDAFGEESKNWQGKTLIVETEKVRVAGKTVVVLYLIPEGYERVDDSGGYSVIVKKGEKPQEQEPADVDAADIIDASNLPF